MANSHLTTVQPATDQPVEIEHLWRDERGDLTAKPRGPIAYTSFVCGTGPARVEIAVDAQRKEAPSVTTLHTDYEPLETILAFCQNLQILMSDARVQAALM